MLKTIPNSQEAEQAVIASILIDSEKMGEVRELLISDFFYNSQHKLIYQAFMDLFSKNKTIDVLTVKNHLEAQNHLVEIGGVEYLTDLAQAIPHSENALEYAHIVYDKFMMRETIKKATNILKEAEEATSSQELIEEAQKEIFSLSEMLRSDAFLNWEDLIKESYDSLRERLQRTNKNITGLATGFVNLDKITAGLQKSDLIILAARPSVGKTAFALNLARNVAHKNDAKVAIFSLEMGAEQLLIRMLAAESKVDIAKIKLGTLTDDDMNYVANGYNSLSELGIYIDDTAGIKIGDLKSKCRKLSVEEGLDLVVIDYLQLLTTNGRIENRQQEVSFISRELKALSKELNIPVVALSQLSRGVEHRTDKRPMMSDIRESGSIEQDADIIMMLYRPEYYGNNLEEEEIMESYDGKTELSLVKHRNGETGILEFKFEKEINRFRPIVTEISE